MHANGTKSAVLTIFPWLKKTTPCSGLTLALRSYIGAVISFITSSPADPNSRAELRPDADSEWPPSTTSSTRCSTSPLPLTSPANISDSYIDSGGAQIGRNDRCEFWGQTRIKGGR
jgi:hypothetical protein